MKKFLSFFTILFSLFAIFSFVSANANSGIRKIQTNSYGLINVKDNPIEVLKEDLIFDLYSNSATVSAEYTFHNQSDDDITAELLFPVGIANLNGIAQVYSPSVYVNSSKIETKMRLMPLHKNEIVDNLKDLSDDYTETILDNYIIYKCKLTNPSNVNLTDLRISGGYILSDLYSIDFDELNKYLDNSSTQLTSTYAQKSFYVLAKGEYTITSDNGSVEYSTTLSSKQELVKDYFASNSTLYRDLYEYYEDVDVYNIYVYQGSTEMYNLELCAVIDYNIDIAANSDCVNKVTTNMEYIENHAYKSTVYEIDYYVSPAKTFRSFKNLNIYLNTDMYLIDSTVDFVDQKDGTYKISYEELIDNDIFIAISHDNSVKNSYSRHRTSNLGVALGGIFGAILAVVIIAALIVAFVLLIPGIVALIISIKNKKIKNNVLHYIQSMTLYVSAFVLMILPNTENYVYLVVQLIVLSIPLTLGILQLTIYDVKKYKWQAIMFDSIVLSIISIIMVVLLFGVGVGGGVLILPCLYLFNLAYLFFKSNFLKNKNQVVEENNEITKLEETNIETNAEIIEASNDDTNDEIVETSNDDEINNN